ncbi:hypothetical protein [Hahella sp. HN01]|uniref:hypothetical protein n=1 Tax=Hahella sp. HN01 TaxID=2847262 RepID=UPI001C1EA2A2|nr:hypothetical protein [Hahella sp. HN01]MBU6954617.1 hypothetical protein [Hahella sp. HN01]
MRLVSAWIIHHKASMSEHSPMNLDGSEYIVGIVVVPASSMREALDVFDEYLSENEMQVMDIWKCEKYDPSNFKELTEESKEIRDVSIEVLESGEAEFVTGESSKVFEDK